MVCIGMQYADNREKGKATSTNCFRRARRLLETSIEDQDQEQDQEQEQEQERRPASSHDNLTTVQAYLFLHVYAILYSCGPDTAHGLRMRAKAVEVSRSCCSP
jgi:uncharacterized membrane protein